MPFLYTSKTIEFSISYVVVRFKKHINWATVVLHCVAA